MQSEPEQTLNNLHVLAALSHNDKLMTNDNAFNIYIPTSVRGAMRMWYGECRTQNIQRIRHTLRSAMNHCTKYMEDANALLETMSTHSESMKLRVDTIALQHIRMLDAITRSRNGLTNMLQTYKDDAAFVSQITLLITEVSDYCNVISCHSRLLRSKCSIADSNDVPALTVHSEVD